MKRILLILLALGLLAGVASAANTTLSVQSTTVASGGTATVPIAIAGATAIGAMDLTVTYDPAVLSFVEAKTGALSTNGMVQANGTTPGRIRIAFVDSSGVNGDGVIITLAFTAKGANGASSKVDLVSRGVYNLDRVDVPVTTQGGTVTIGSGGKSPLPVGVAIVALLGAGLVAVRRRKRQS
jgi:MYXO-CTERM domain-containing protein